MEQILYPILGISLIFLCTTIGSLFVFFLGKKEISPRLNKIFTGFAAGVMLSASFFSLIKPALETTLTYMPSWLVVVISILLGALFLWGIDKLVPHFHVGAVVSLPLKSESGSSGKAFLFGMLSGVVEPLAAVIGLFLAMQIQGIMPWALAFAAGCMIYVVAEEMIPEMSSDGHGHFGVWSFLLGFVIMLALDCIQF